MPPVADRGEDYQYKSEFKNGVFSLTAQRDAILALTFLLNISTRLQVGTGDNVLIGGFILQGSEAKKIMAVRSDRLSLLLACPAPWPIRSRQLAPDGKRMPC